MPYDPRMLQMARMGVGMMAPQQGSPFPDPRDPRNRPKQWWEQMPAQAGGLGGAQSPQDDPSKPDDPNAPKKPQPSLLQMLMLGGPATYSGTPAPQSGPQQGSPWGWPGYGGGGGRP